MKDREILDFIQNGKTKKDAENEQDLYGMLYHFTGERENILNWYPFCKDADLLEVDGACGAITGMLCDKVAHVVSCECSAEAKEANCLRHAEKKNLQVVAGKFGEASFDRVFDYIVINDVFSRAKQYMREDDAYSALLKKTLKLLKPGGKLLIAVENRLGLRYFTGAPEKNSGAMFLGLNAYYCYDECKSFSKKEWNSLLAACGDLKWKFYYPYPDHIFPNEIFTDESINEMGYGKDSYNFENKRFLLYNENSVAKALAKEQVADRFANSFLIEVSKENLQDEEQIVYVKIDSDRNEKFRIATKIVCHGSERAVYKYAMNPDAEQHLENVHVQEENDANKNIKSLISEKTPKGLKYEFLTGKTVDSEIKEFIFAGKREELKNKLDEIFEIYFVDSKVADYECEEFQRVFGGERIESKLECIKPANIDLICDNIFTVDDGYAVIDCEWIFDMHVPKQFIIWRNLNELFYKYAELTKLFGKNELYQSYGINDTMNSVFESWNRHFTLEYVGANRMEKYAVPKLQVSLDEIAASFERRKWINCSLYIDRGAGYSEDTKIYREIRLKDGYFSCNYHLENLDEIKNIRWDPTEQHACICRAFIEMGKETYRLPAVNADGMQEGKDVFINADPQYEFMLRANRCADFKIYGYIYYLNGAEIQPYLLKHFDKWRKKDCYIQAMENAGRELEDERQRLLAERQRLLNECNGIVREKEQLQQLITMMQESRGWKLLDKLRRIRQKIRRA